jgi:hypothetical protein
MPKQLHVADLLKPVKPRPYPKRPRPKDFSTAAEPGMVSVQIEIPYRVFDRFRGKSGRGWKARMARSLEKAAEET